MSLAIAIPVKFKYYLGATGRRSGIVFMRTDFTKETVEPIYYVDLNCVSTQLWITITIQATQLINNF